MPHQLFKDRDDKWRYRIRGKNHEIMATSEAYSSKSNAQRGYEQLVRELGGSVETIIHVKEPPLKYGIADLAEEIHEDILTTRLRLRRAGVPKTNGRYGWRTRAELREVVKVLKS